jgi:tRNA 2-selenouridine synthase
MNVYLELLKNKTPFIDLRSPIEFAKGTFPQSVNLPILNNDERAEVGKTYKHHGNAAAVELGHRLISGDHKEIRVSGWEKFIDKNPSTWMYCMRGGQRSNIAQDWLDDIGVKVPIVSGGYKALRQASLEILDSVKDDKKRWIILGGRTGTGKTVILNQIESSIDLEHHAEHRGSAFGGFLSHQPSPMDFENRLAINYLRHDHQTLVLEDESRNIGKVAIPNIWFQRMQNSEMIFIEISLEERIQNIIEDYVITPIGDGISKTDLLLSLRSSLMKIQKRLGGDNFREIRNKMDQAFLDSKNYGQEAWIKQLLNVYYDPLYDYQIKSKVSRCIYQSDTKGVTEFLSELESD